MTIIDDITNGLSGAFDMARARAGWEDRMDMSAGAVFASFMAFPLALPGLALAALGAQRFTLAEGKDPDPLFSMIVMSAASSYVVWGLVVWFYIQVAKRLDAGWRISPLLIAHNWSVFLAYSLLGLGMAVTSSANATGAYAMVWPLIFALGLWLDWGMLRQGLGLEKDATFVTIIFVQIAAIFVSMIVSSIMLLLSSVLPGGGS